MDHELRTLHKSDELLSNVCKAGLAHKLRTSDAVHGSSGLVDISLGVQIPVELPTRESTADKFDATDLNDPMPLRDLKPRGLGVEDDLSHMSAYKLQAKKSEPCIRAS